MKPPTAPRVYYRRALAAAPLVRSVEVHAELGSTSDRAKQLADEAAPADLPALVLAERQTAGRGRGDNRWWSGEGALAFSLLVDPAALRLDARLLGAASLATALAVCDAARDVAAVDALVKWPNDVVVGEKKLAGVLLEAPRRDRLVIGVGVNVASDLAAAPAEVRDRATTLAAAGAAPTAQGTLLAVLRRLEERLAQLADGDPALPREWNRLSALAGGVVTLRVGGAPVSGRCVALASDGALTLDCAGVERRFVTGTVEAWRPAPQTR